MAGINDLNQVEFSKAVGINGQMTVSVKELEAKQDAQLKELISTAEAAGEIEDMEKAQEDLEAELKELNKEKATLEKKIELIEKEVKALTKEAIKLYEEAIDEQEDLSDEQKAKAKEISQEEVDKFVEECQKAAEEGEKGPDRSALAGRINSAMTNSNLSFDSKFAKVMRNLTESNEMFDEIDDHLDAVRGYAFDIQAIDMDIASTNNALDNVKKNIEAKEAQQCDPPPTCDPIGFVANDGTQYDFVVAGENGTLDSTSEFLGAEDQWAAMQALDSDRDGKVTSEELEKGGVSVVANKGNEAKDISDTFGEGFSIDLKSYQSGANQTVNGVSAGDHDEDGYADQELLGTFQVNMGDGNIITGYNTLDDVDYLKEEYNLGEAGDQRTLLGNDIQEKIAWVDGAQKTSDMYHNKINEVINIVAPEQEAEIKAMQSDLKMVASEQAISTRAQFDKEAEEFVAQQIAAQEAAEAEKQDEKAATTQTVYSLEGDKLFETDAEGNKTEVKPEEGKEYQVGADTYIVQDGKFVKKDEAEK